MNQELSYRFRTTGISGTICLSDGKVLSDVFHRYTRWNFSIPLSSISADPIRICRTTRAFFICALTALAMFFLSLLAIIDHSQFRYNLIFGPILMCFSLIPAVLAIRYRVENWVLFPTDSPIRTIAFAQSGPDSDRFEEFVQLLTSALAAVPETSARRVFQ